MEQNNILRTESLSQYLQSIVNVQDLLNITDNMEKELQDSQDVLDHIKTMFGSVSKEEVSSSHSNNEQRHEDLSQFLTASGPTLLMPDMIGNMTDVDLDNIIASMKSYAEDLRKNYVVVEPKRGCAQRDINNIDLKQYASSLDQLVKQLGNIKLNKQSEAVRNVELEEKLAKLCEDVNMFTMMVEEKAKQSETNKLWRPMEDDNSALDYDNMINKLLSGINEVTYLLKNRG